MSRQEKKKAELNREPGYRPAQILWLYVARMLKGKRRKHCNCYVDSLREAFIGEDGACNISHSEVAQYVTHLQTRLGVWFFTFEYRIRNRVYFCFVCTWKNQKEEERKIWQVPLSIILKNSRNRAKIGFHSLLVTKMVILLFLLVTNNDCKDLCPNELTLHVHNSILHTLPEYHFVKETVVGRVAGSLVHLGLFWGSYILLFQGTHSQKESSW